MFKNGPFTFESGESRSVNGAKTVRWNMSYGAQDMGWHTLPASATQAEVLEAFSSERARFERAARSDHAPDVLRLADSAGNALATIEVTTWPDGMSGCIPDDQFEFWLLTETKPTRGRSITLQEFAAICAKNPPSPLQWVCGLLPGDVLTSDLESWRAPTSWELRHIVGEGSFTGITGAQAAALVGVTPQNFRKYLAADSASTRQPMGFAMWHALLHKLGVKSMRAVA
ncbi:MAG: hypothetical protein REI09_05140 [Candidatus Dactylopiibacterium sp.]|nr:hypothetical protein [Candidatus Dactylopiibacterium sp.]